MRILMQGISVVFHPLLLPTLMFFVIFRYVPQAFRPLPDEAVPYVLIALCTTTLVIPVLSLLALKLTSSIKSLQMAEREDRIIPFTFIGAFYAITTYKFYDKLNLNPVLVKLMLVATVLIATLTIITLFWKISIHSAGMGGLVGFILALVRMFPGSELLAPFTIAVVALGWVMTARLFLKAHAIDEVVAGAVLGTTFCYTVTLAIN